MTFLLLFGLAACQSVTGEKITAADMAAAIPEFRAVPADTELGYAPAPGACRTFSGGVIQQQAARLGVTTTYRNSVCFEWPMRKLERGEVNDVLQRARKDRKVELDEYSIYPVPPGEIVFPSSSLNEPPHGPALWRGYVRYAGERRMNIWAKVHFSEARASGETSEVSIGDRVQVVVRSGAAQLKFEAKAESAGSKGEMVRVRNPLSGKTFAAEVMAKNMAKNSVLVKPR